MADFSAVDHFVVAGPDLAALGEWWADAVGTDAVEGGAHTGLGTRNLLAGIDSNTYVELIGPDPDQPDPSGPRPFGIDDLTDRRLVTFALAVPDLDAACAAVSASGIDPGEPFGMERTRPDGVRLQWRLAFPSGPELAGVMPFLIEWGTSAHPAVDLPSQTRLTQVSLQHPDAARIETAVRALAGDTWHVAHGPANVSASLETPEGRPIAL